MATKRGGYWNPEAYIASDRKSQSVFVTPDGWYTDWPVLYSNGTVGWDSPGRIPQYLKRAVTQALHIHEV